MMRPPKDPGRAVAAKQVTGVGDEVLSAAVLVEAPRIDVRTVPIDLDHEHRLGVREVDLEHVVTNPYFEVEDGIGGTLGAKRFRQHDLGPRVTHLELQRPSLEHLAQDTRT